ncbi:MAG: type II toxin-antitoxin system RelE/ParE family toxin [Deltaproteobacteria bacterium]|nr:type II toxin-antitoxin system RelE/ParE family toxin [Deltaproteobacteria bacterium]
MPTDSPQSVHVEYTPEFKRSLRKLARKYRSIRTDLESVINGLQKGELVGDHITGMDYTLFKSRMRSSDIQKGKRSGYRLIYWLRTPKHVILVTIYSKLDQGDISAKEIRRIIKQFQEL